MKTLEYRTVDKSEWGEGPWMDEPDKKQWTDKATGLPCLIHRGPSGSLCGYVGVADGHPAFGVPYQDLDMDVHGCLTYSDFCQPSGDESHGICHLPEPGEPDHVWWLGFDCAHTYDISPERISRDFAAGYSLTPERAEYRDIAYVTSECERLAAQLANLK